MRKNLFKVIGKTTLCFISFFTLIFILDFNISKFNLIENFTTEKQNNINVTTRSGEPRVKYEEYDLFKMIINGQEELCFNSLELAESTKEKIQKNTQGVKIDIIQEKTNIIPNYSDNEYITKITNNYISKYAIPKTCFPTQSHYISSYYGKRKSRGDFHSGIDLAGKYGDNIYAYKDGKICLTKYSNVSYGNMILIEHKGNMKSRYAHLSSINVKNGQNVKCGEIIGKMGSTGNSTGNHLHFEIIINGKPVNPYNYIF